MHNKCYVIVMGQLWTSYWNQRLGKHGDLSVKCWWAAKVFKHHCFLFCALHQLCRAFGICFFPWKRSLVFSKMRPHIFTQTHTHRREKKEFMSLSLLQFLLRTVGKDTAYTWHFASFAQTASSTIVKQQREVIWLQECKWTPESPRLPGTLLFTKYILNNNNYTTIVMLVCGVFLTESFKLRFKSAVTYTNPSQFPISSKSLN